MNIIILLVGSVEPAVVVAAILDSAARTENDGDDAAGVKKNEALNQYINGQIQLNGQSNKIKMLRNADVFDCERAHEE